MNEQCRCGQAGGDGQSITIPTHHGIPETTNAMKAKFIGEFFVDHCEYDEDGNEHNTKLMIDWITCKDIYKQMAMYAAEQADEQ